MLAVNGWSIAAHPLFLGQLERLTAAVESAKAKDAENYQGTANAKLLAALEDLVFRTIPDDPARPVYRQGSTLGGNRKHWFRAKFGGQRFRLFFRFSSEAKIIIFAWVNDEKTLRTYGSKTDAYAVFKSMLDDGNPPDDWVALLKAASTGEAQKRLATAQGRE
jgi:toxin YhaV